MYPSRGTTSFFLHKGQKHYADALLSQNLTIGKFWFFSRFQFIEKIFYRMGIEKNKKGYKKDLTKFDEWAKIIFRMDKVYKRDRQTAKKRLLSFC